MSSIEDNVKYRSMKRAFYKVSDTVIFEIEIKSTLD